MDNGKKYPDGVLQPNGSMDCGFYAAYYLMTLAGLEVVTPEVFKEKCSTMSPEYKIREFVGNPAWMPTGSKNIDYAYRISSARVLGHREWLSGYLLSGHTVIAHIEDGHAHRVHAVVLLECTTENILIFDPLSGLRNLTWSDYLKKDEGRTWSRVCAVFWLNR